MDPIIQAQNIVKTFPGVMALAGISFDLYPGEIHCIVGENGAGKSTFIKILSGFLRPDQGEIQIRDKKYRFLTPHTAQSLGIQVVYQENILVPQMSVAENVFVGRELSSPWGMVNHRKTIEEAQKIIDSLEIDLSAQEAVENLSVAEQQFVKIVRALAFEPQMLIMDEPTAVFNVKDAQIVLNLARSISKRGIGIIYISHRLEEIIDLADRITVFKDGKKVACHDNREEKVDIPTITKEMVGRDINLFYRKEKKAVEKPILEVRGLRLSEASPSISFSLHEGEILGVAGLVGSGRTEIMKALFGAGKKFSGEVFYRGEKINITSPQEAIKIGMGFITEDRQKTGLAMGLSIIKNITLPSLDDLFPGYLIPLPQEARIVENYVQQLDIKTPSLEQEVRFLSGGNQQKVVLARWLLKEAEIIIFDEPTVGIDVNAKNEIHELIANLAQEGKSIIMISSEMPELIALSDRVIVITRGAISAELKEGEITEENIIFHAFGVNTNE